MSAAIENRVARKAARRSPSTWVDGDPQPRCVRRTESVGRSESSHSKSDLIRFPLTPSVARPDAVVQRLNTVQALWSNREREQRRMQAIAKQEDLLLMLADAALEDDMRLAVADGEQPILPPEIEILRN